MRKRGRPKATYRCVDGTEIPGLAKQADGRWRISETGEVFFATDEFEALARYQAAMAKIQGRDQVQLPLGPQSNPASALAAARKAGGTKLSMLVGPNGQPPDYSIQIGSEAFYAAVKKMIIEQPKLMAQKTGIEQLGYLNDLPKPSPSQELASIGELYASKPGLSANEAGRSRLFWKEFCKAVQVKTVRELTADAIASYEGTIVDSDYAPKSILHRYRKVRTVLAHAIKRGRGIEECRRALDLCALLEVKAPRSLDPRPIAPDDFWNVHAKAEAGGDHVFATLMLAGLNLSMYGSEVGALLWDQVDLKTGWVSARRHKTDVPRIGVLWPETLRAIRKLPKDRETIFNTRIRSYTQYSVVASWTKYRVAADVKDTVVFSCLRDAAYSIALTVSLDQARLLAGHRLPGSSDHYVMRNPQMVADACEAIRRKFAVPAHFGHRR